MKRLSNLDFNQNELQNAVIQNLAVAPSSPKKGQVYYSTATNRTYYWNNTAWKPMDADDAAMDGADIVTAINGSASIIDDDNLSAGVNAAVTKAHDTHAISDVTGLQTALDAKETPAGAQTKATTALNDAKSYTDTAISNLVATAPDTLNTLNELAQALGDDPNFATTITNDIASRTKKVAASLGDGVATTFVVTHNLNTQDVSVTIREAAAPYAMVMTDVEFTSATTLTVKFGAAPTANQYKVTIIG